MAGGTCVAGGACVAGETVTGADGMHPTGMHCYRPQTKFAKVMFYTCLSFCSQGGQGACVAGGHAWQGRGACVVGGRACVTLRDTVSQCAGGTHPTGMHSCYYQMFAGMWM